MSRLSSIDGISFTTIANSQVLRSAFRAQGYIIPKSHQTVHDLVMKYFEKFKKKVIGSLKKIILTNDKFSLTFDEYKSVKNRRCMNLNIHYNGGFQSLGMLRVNGTMPASKAIEQITKKT